MLTDVAKILLVHGAFHGAWCWDKLLPELEARHLDAEAVELPFTSPADDVAEVAGTIDRLAGTHHRRGPLLRRHDNHSRCRRRRGGQAVSHLVYLMAVMQNPGEPLDLGETPTPGMRAIRFTGEEIRLIRIYPPSGSTTAASRRTPLGL